MEYTDYKNSKVLVRSPKVDDFDRVKVICEDRFGEGYLSKEEFIEWVNDGEYCKVAVADGKIVGIVYLKPEEPDTVAKFLKMSKDFIVSVAGGKKVIHSRCAALDKEYERRGIIYFLHDEIFDNIKANGFGAVFAPAWTYKGTTPMAKLLNKYDFDFLCEKDNLWYDIENYKCIICGGKCKCKAAIYIKKY